jgi:glycosyltransferase involved in cell wall biosynthesis
MINKKKIKVLRIINRFNIGGPTYNATFLTRFISDDYETLLVGGLPEEHESDSLHILEEYGVKAQLIEEMKRTPNFFNDRKAYLKIKEIIRDFEPDIVHTHAAKAGALGRKAAKNMKVPIIVHTYHGHVFHSYFGKFKTTLYKIIERRLAKISSGIIAISDIQKAELSEQHNICPPAKIKVIQLGFDLNRFHEDIAEKRQNTREKFQIASDELAIAIIGRLAPVKNHQLFLNSITEIAAKTSKKVKFFIVGDGDEKLAIETIIKELALPDNFKIIMTSWIKDISTFNPGMDLICLTSLNEGTPVSLIEAQAANIPILTTDVGGVRDIVKENVTGCVVSNNSLTEFAEKLLFLIENDSIRNEMSQNGWEFVKSRFHYTTLVKNMENYYSELINKRNDQQQ